MSGLLRDLRHAARALRRAPLLFWTAALTIGAGLGLSTGVMAVAYGMLLRPLPYADPDRLVAVTLRYRADGRTASVGFGELDEWRQRFRVFDQLAGHSLSDFTIHGAGDPRIVTAAMVTDGFFEALKVPAEDGSVSPIAAGAPAAVISSRLADQLGRSGEWRTRGLTIGGRDFQIAAILPPGFDVPSGRIELWVSAGAVPEIPLFGFRDQRRFQLVGRLAPGVSLAHARDDARRVAAEIDAGAGKMRQRDADVEPLGQRERQEAARTVLPFLAGSILVLLIACANVSGLLVGRAMAREREFAIRKALGIRVGELLRASIAEAAIVTVCGWAAGLWLAHTVVLVFKSLAPASFSNAATVGLDGAVIAASFAMAAVVALASGAAPALRAVRAASNPMLRQVAPRRGRAFGGTLVAAQVALTVVLLVSAALLMRTVQRVVAAERGFDTDRAVTMRLMLAHTVRFELADRTPLVDRLLAEVRALPGVAAAGVGSDLPPAGTQLLITLRLVREDRGEETFALAVAAVTPGYLEALGATVSSGRWLEEDDRRASPPRVLVTETGARMLFGSADPVGREWPAPLPAAPGTPRVKPLVVGVVKDVKYGGVERDTAPTLFVPWELLAPGKAHLVVRTVGPPESVAPALGRILRELDPTLPVFPPETLDEVLSGSIADRTLRLQLGGAFAGLALALAVIALWGSVAQAVLDRRHELAVRLALGASTGAAVRLMLRSGVALIGAGLVLGTAGAAVTARLLGHLLFGLSPIDPPSFLAAVAVVTAAALVACYLPARRAAAISPAELLRQQV